MTSFNIPTYYNKSYKIDIYETRNINLVDKVFDFVFLLNFHKDTLRIEKIVNIQKENLSDVDFTKYQYFGYGLFSTNENIIDGKTGKDSGITPFDYMDINLRNELPK